MRALFVCSGNSGISPIVNSQAESLVKYGVDVEMFPIIGKGVVGYLSAIPKLAKTIKRINPDIVHAHYSFCGIIAALSTGKAVVTSLMGSDVIQSGLMRWVISIFIKHLWSVTIVKSEDMKQRVGITQLIVLPNGVDFEVFKPSDKTDCKNRVDWDINRKHILFAADPTRPEKNYRLAEQAVRMSEYSNIELKVVFGIPQADIPLYLNASDLLILTSIWEGSPNIVKEAMACNVPVVATDVGDVRMLFGDTKGYLVAESDAKILSEAIQISLNENSPTEGRSRLAFLGIDSNSIAAKLTGIYLQSMEGK